MFNSRVSIAVKSNGESQSPEPRVITPRSRRVSPGKSRKRSISVNTIGNPGIILSQDHPANVIEKRRRYAAREYLDKTAELGQTISPLAVSALGLSQSKDGTWGVSGTPDERLYGQNLTKYLDTQLVPRISQSTSVTSKMKERIRRLHNRSYSNRDSVSFGTIIRDPYFKVNMSTDDNQSKPIAVGRDETSGRIVNPLAELTSHHFAGQTNFLNTIDGIENSAFPRDRSTTPKITNVTGAINRGLRSHFKKFNDSLFVSPEGDSTYFFGKFTTLSNNIKKMFAPYDKTELRPPTQEQLFDAKKSIRQKRPELFDEQGGYVNSETADKVNDVISRYVIDRNNKQQLKQHQNEYDGLTRALDNIAVCPCPHCQISNYNNPLATVLDASLHRGKVLIPLVHDHIANKHLPDCQMEAYKGFQFFLFLG